jgi:transposase InsO family protein
MTPRCAFVGEPATNGVVERFFRTLKAQVVHGRVFGTIEDVRDAMRACTARTNAAWLVEKNGHLSPTPSAASTNLPPCPWPHSLTKCPRNRVRFDRALTSDDCSIPLRRFGSGGRSVVGLKGNAVRSGNGPKPWLPPQL